MRMYLVKCGRFRSHDKDGAYTSRSAIAENLILHANFTALSPTEPEAMPIKVLHCRNRDFQRFCSCDLDLDPFSDVNKTTKCKTKTKTKTKEGKTKTKTKTRNNKTKTDQDQDQDQDQDRGR